MKHASFSHTAQRWVNQNNMLVMCEGGVLRIF